MQARMLVPAPRPRGQAKIALSGVAHRYANVTALSSVSLDIAQGEFVCLLGPSGCGKSTLLYALAGHVSPSGGHITIDGRPLRGPSRDRLLVFQEPALFPWLTAKQNVSFALRAKGMRRCEADARAREFLAKVQLTGFEGALPHELSGGMQMRVSLARALAMDPAILLMDEPFGALDAQTRSEMHRLLQSITTQTRKTVVFVTHDVREALVLGDRVVVLAGRPGRVLQDLEVRLARPRDPDDEVLVTLSRHIRQLIRAARQEQAGQPRQQEEVVAHGDGAAAARPAGSRRLLGRAPGGLGTPL